MSQIYQTLIFLNLARVIKNEAYSQDYTIIFSSSDENIKKFDKVFNFFQSIQEDRFIIAAPEGYEDLLVSLKELKVPILQFDRYFTKLDSTYVIVDNSNASQQATNCLIKK